MNRSAEDDLMMCDDPELEWHEALELIGKAIPYWIKRAQKAEKLLRVSFNRLLVDVDTECESCEVTKRTRGECGGCEDKALKEEIDKFLGDKQDAHR